MSKVVEVKRIRKRKIQKTEYRKNHNQEHSINISVEEVEISNYVYIDNNHEIDLENTQNDSMLCFDYDADNKN